jgi:hypothetical protein
VICCEDFSASNYAEFEAAGHAGRWFPSPYCESCVRGQFIAKQWDLYMENLAKADCAAALRRLLSAPPPLMVSDAGFKVAELNNSGEVARFWFASTNSEISAKIDKAPEGDAREKFWAEKKAFLTQQELIEEQAKKDKKANNAGNATDAAEEADS